MRMTQGVTSVGRLGGLLGALFLLGSATVGAQAPRVSANLSAQDSQPIGFTGYVKDSESGLYYAGTRYYDPTIGRFTTEDPKAGVR